MSTRTDSTNAMLANSNKDLNVPDNEFNAGNGKAVFLYMKVKEVATLDEICKDLDMGHFTTGGIVSILLEKGYVERDGDKVIFSG